MPLIQFHLDLNNNELRRAVVHKLAAAPSTPTEGQIYYNSIDKFIYSYNGSAWTTLTSTLSTITATAPLIKTGTSSAPILSIDIASASTAGSMSISDKVKLDAATSINSASTLVIRDGLGNISSSTFTGLLIGTADNAALLNNQSSSYHLSRTNHAGTQLATTISNFDSQVRTNTLNQLAAPTLALSLNSQKITNLATPTLGTDAATKAYTDTLVSGISIVAKYSVSIGDGTTTSYTITHNLNSRDVIARIYTSAAPYAMIITDIEHTTINTITLIFTTPPTLNQYRVVVIA